MTDRTDMDTLEFLLREYQVTTSALVEELQRHEDVPKTILVALGMIAYAIEDAWGHEDA